MRSFAKTAAVLALGLAVPVLPAAHAQQNNGGNNAAYDNGGNKQQSYPALQNELQRAQRQHRGIPLLPSMDIVGRGVVDANGNNVGPVNSLVIDSRNGVIEYVLIAANGDYSPNGGLIAVPWSELAQPGGQGMIALNVAGQQLAEAPHVNRNAVAQLGNPMWRNRIYGYWGRQYPFYGTMAWYAPYFARHPYARNNASNRDTVGSGSANGNGDNNSNNQQANNQQTNDQSGNNRQNGNQQGHALQVNNNGIVSMLQKPYNVQPNQLHGVNVYGQDGQVIGAIDQVMVDTRSGHVAYVLVKRSGFLGLNPVWFPVPIQAMQWTRNAGNNGDGGSAADGGPNRRYAGGYWGGYYGHDYGWELTVNTQALNYLPPVPVNMSNLTRYAPPNDLARLYDAFGVEPYWNRS